MKKLVALALNIMLVLAFTGCVTNQNDANTISEIHIANLPEYIVINEDGTAYLSDAESNPVNFEVDAEDINKYTIIDETYEFYENGNYLYFVVLSPDAGYTFKNGFIINHAKCKSLLCKDKKGTVNIPISDKNVNNIKTEYDLTNISVGDVMLYWEVAKLDVINIDASGQMANDTANSNVSTSQSQGNANTTSPDASSVEENVSLNNNSAESNSSEMSSTNDMAAASNSTTSAPQINTQQATTQTCNHELYIDVCTPATCTETGMQHHICSKCGEVWNEALPINQSNHTSFSIKNRLWGWEAGHDGAVYTGDLYCDDCGALLDTGAYKPEDDTDNIEVFFNNYYSEHNWPHEGDTVGIDCIYCMGRGLCGGAYPNWSEYPNYY